MYRGLSGNLPVSLSFANLTSGNNQVLKPGDRFLIEIHGNANWPVTVTGTKDGKAFAFPPMGATDGNGVFRLEGVMSANEVGSWMEQWFVGGAHAGTILFKVLPETAATPPPVIAVGTLSNSADGWTYRWDGSQYVKTATRWRAAAAGDSDYVVTAPVVGYVPTPPVQSLIPAEFSGIPMWAFAAAGLGALFLFGGRK